MGLFFAPEKKKRPGNCRLAPAAKPGFQWAVHARDGAAWTMRNSSCMHLGRYRQRSVSDILTMPNVSGKPDRSPSARAENAP